MIPRQAGDARALRFAGYAALFGRPDCGRDTIRRGAFARTLAQRRHPLPLYWQHRPDLRIGWVEAAREDARGLRVVATIDNPQGAAGLALRRGAVTGLSFGFRARDSRRSEAGRELLDIELLEVSLVTHPMQHEARVHLVAPPPPA
ncbi:HK97 family phage prohead protease [Novosphingobium soli]|uniref:HK97 family phage prohead protease n=1 Tax=Novosphingobium soli TaxID=574956 RepID=A0ABV6CU17_9SPHN